MNRSLLAIFAASAIALFLAGCSTTPATHDDRQQLHDDVSGALRRLYLEDPGLQNFLDSSYGYAVFPTVGKGGLIAGGAYGHGEVFQQGAFIGYTDISQATIGAQIGGQSFTEVVAFESPGALQRFESGQFAFDANASAVALKSGAAASAKYTNGVAIFVEPVGGLMVEAAVGGQSFSYQPK
jgi:lipid-binding SYLF domain-containing protein